LELDEPARDVVLRRYPPGDDAAQREARVLHALDGLDGWAPRVLDVDPDGRRFGEPSIVTTRLPGTADIMPASPRTAAEQLGRGLARIHEVPLGALGWLRDGMAAGDDAGPTAPIGEPDVLTHFDYWSGNVLWDGPVLTGIVDWSGAARAPRGFDVAWCRLDLVLLHGREEADVFLEAYERAAGTTIPDVAAWDRVAAEKSRLTVETWEPNYTSLGRIDLTAAELRARHTRWAESLV
jgi:aminoglycoside phosphotransferase (APT) family kinase protein